MFPRSNERGPIEAPHPGYAGTPPPSRFRARTSAAPLKLRAYERIASERTREFPRSNERGPIEAEHKPFREITPRGFRARTSAAPLKLFSIDDGPSRAPGVSALERARPH